MPEEESFIDKELSWFLLKVCANRDFDPAKMKELAQKLKENIIEFYDLTKQYYRLLCPSLSESDLNQLVALISRYSIAIADARDNIETVNYLRNKREEEMTAILVKCAGGFR